MFFLIGGDLIITGLSIPNNFIIWCCWSIVAVAVRQMTGVCPSKDRRSPSFPYKGLNAFTFLVLFGIPLLTTKETKLYRKSCHFIQGGGGVLTISIFVEKLGLGNVSFFIKHLYI